MNLLFERAGYVTLLTLEMSVFEAELQFIVLVGFKIQNAYIYFCDFKVNHLQ